MEYHVAAAMQHVQGHSEEDDADGDEEAELYGPYSSLQGLLIVQQAGRVGQVKAGIHRAGVLSAHLVNYHEKNGHGCEDVHEQSSDEFHDDESDGNRRYARREEALTRCTRRGR